jgi:hypothetical protein
VALRALHECTHGLATSYTQVPPYSFRESIVDDRHLSLADTHAWGELHRFSSTTAAHYRLNAPHKLTVTFSDSLRMLPLCKVATFAEMREFAREHAW